jgi:uncharacterized peroxidase-related enzyme
MTHHGAALRRVVKDVELVNALGRDWRTATLSPQDLVLCEFAESLTLRPEHSSDRAVMELRRAGFSERAILDTCQVVAYFNFVNRIALGLGVELESYWKMNEILGND